LPAYTLSQFKEGESRKRQEKNKEVRCPKGALNLPERERKKIFTSEDFLLVERVTTSIGLKIKK